MNETIQLDENTRAIVSQDPFQDNPLNWGDFGVLVLSQPRLGGSSLDEAEYITDDRVRELDRLYQFGTEYPYYGDPIENEDALKEAVLKSLKRRGKFAEVVNWRGYSQGDWLDFIIWNNDTGPYAQYTVAKELQDWLAGDIFYAQFEYSATGEDEDYVEYGGCGGIFFECPYLLTENDIEHLRTMSDDEKPDYTEIEDTPTETLYGLTRTQMVNVYKFVEANY